MIPRVVDTSHYTTVTNLKKTAAAGIWGVITKCTQGTHIIDGSYHSIRNQTLDAGMLFGAYAFGENADGAAQCKYFLTHAVIDNKTLPCLDFETYPHSQMTPHQMVDFLSYGEKQLGRKFVIYSGNQLKEVIGDMSIADQLYICSHKLWLAQYGSKAILPEGFEKYFLWQYTGDGEGPHPHSVPGLGGSGQDLNIYNGTKEQLTAEWVVQPAPPVVVANI